MRTGQLRHLVTIERKSQVKDGQGGNTDTWNSRGATFAAIWPVSGGERVRNQQLEGEITHRIRIRFEQGITADMRINNYGTIYKIIGAPINVDMRNRYLEFLCREEA